MPVVDSEFAAVSVELETIAWPPDGHLAQLLDPSVGCRRDA